MDYIFLTGILGSIILVIGAAWKDGKVNSAPLHSVKNWLFTIGTAMMLLYAVLGYLNGGAVFFVILQILLLCSCVLMMTSWNHQVKTILLMIAGAGLLLWSLYLFDDKKIVLFVVGLISIALGYVFKMGSLQRSVALTLGSFLIAGYSYLESSWVFFGLNLIFGLFSGYYVLHALATRKKSL